MELKTGPCRCPREVLLWTGEVVKCSPRAGTGEWCTAQSLVRIGRSLSHTLDSAASFHAMLDPHALDGACGKPKQNERKEKMKTEMDKRKNDPESAFEVARDRCLEHLAAAQRRIDTTSDRYVFSPVSTLLEFTVSAAQMATGSDVPSTLLDAITAVETELEISEIPGFVLTRVLLERAAVFAQDMCDAAKSMREGR